MRFYFQYQNVLVHIGLWDDGASCNLTVNPDVGDDFSGNVRGSSRSPCNMMPRSRARTEETSCSAVQNFLQSKKGSMLFFFGDSVASIREKKPLLDGTVRQCR